MSGPEPGLEREPSAALTACGRLIGAVGIVIVVVLLPATFLVVAGRLGLIDTPGWAGGNTSTYAFVLLVVPLGLAVAALHFIVGGLMLWRRLWPLVAAVLLVAAVATVFPIGLRIAWPFLSLTALYVVSLVLVLRHLDEFE